MSSNLNPALSSISPLRKKNIVLTNNFGIGVC